MELPLNNLQEKIQKMMREGEYVCDGFDMEETVKPYYWRDFWEKEMKPLLDLLVHARCDNCNHWGRRKGCLFGWLQKPEDPYGPNPSSLCTRWEM